MPPTAEALNNHDALFPGHVSTLKVTDPELIEYLDNFPSTGSSATAAWIRGPERGITLPLEGQSTTTPETRMAKGLAVQKKIVGEEPIDQMYASAPEDEMHIQRLLSANCFGDHYTRTGIDIKTRELLTFAMLISLGGREPQAKGHVAANLNVGNDRGVLLSVITQLLPFIGYPALSTRCA